MTILSHPLFINQRGSGLFIIFDCCGIIWCAVLRIPVAEAESGICLKKKNRLIASEMIDTGNRFSEIVSIMKLHGIKEDKISFEYNAEL